MKKHNNGGLVYSTESGRTCPECEQPVDSCLCDKTTAAPQGDGVVRIRRESKGRGGKQVSIINGLPLGQADLKDLARALKAQCGSGGSVKDGEIILQGDKRTLAKTILEGKGYRVKLFGG